jgi:hypothetical protein
MRVGPVAQENLDHVLIAVVHGVVQGRVACFSEGSCQ